MKVFWSASSTIPLSTSQTSVCTNCQFPTLSTSQTSVCTNCQFPTLCTPQTSVLYQLSIPHTMYIANPTVIMAGPTGHHWIQGQVWSDENGYNIYDSFIKLKFSLKKTVQESAFQCAAWPILYYSSKIALFAKTFHICIGLFQQQNCC